MGYILYITNGDIGFKAFQHLFSGVLPSDKHPPRHWGSDSERQQFSLFLHPTAHPVFFYAHISTNHTLVLHGDNRKEELAFV